LTGILNRKGILRAMQTTAFLSKRVDSPIGIIMADIDHFKAVNDKHGHDTGDIVLSEVAAILRKTVRRSDLVGRLGGEEFVVLACPVDHEGLSLLAEKLRAAVEQGRPGGLSVTASFGAVLSGEISDPEAEMNRLLKVADEQLYNAKNSGRNCVVGL
jgi:diguanylate cyclase (GGDEF)-like protein